MNKLFKTACITGWTILFMAFLSTGCMGQPVEKETQKADSNTANTISTAKINTDIPVRMPDDPPASEGEESARGNDPFKPVIKPWQSGSGKDGGKGDIVCPEIKFTRQTPLEYIPLEQLKLKGIVITEKGNHALIEDADGKPYVIRKGTKMGTNWGYVKEISKGQLIIEEKFMDEECKIINKDRSMALPKRPST